MLELTIKGKTYAEKKANLRELAIVYQRDFKGLYLEYGEILDVINDYFYTNAKRYGLLKEFKENGII